MMDLRRGRGKERAFDNQEVLVENYLNMREGLKGLNLEQTGGPKDTEFDEKYSRAPQFPLDNWISGNDFDMNTSRSTSVNASLGDIPSHLKNFAGSVRSRGTVDQWGVERDRFEGFYGSPRLHSEQRGIPNEGPSNYKLDSFDGEQKYRGDLCEVEDLEQDRAELLWKLDELKEKLSRAYDVVGEKPREKMVPMEHSRTPPDPYGDRLTYNLSMQPYAVDKQMTRPPYMDMQNFYAHQRHGLNAIPEYEGPSQPQLNMRHPHQALHYRRPPPHEYFMGNHMDSNLNYLASYTHENVFHSPACSCLDCYNQNFGTGRVPQAPSNLNAYQHVNPGTFLPHDYNPRHATPPPPLNRRWKNDIESDNDGYGDRHPRRAVAVNRQHGKIFHPVAGGAPFISCFSCFELLKLPRKLKKANMNGSKLRCGSCSTVILLGIKNKKLITSVSKEMKLSSEVDQRSNEVLKGSSFSSCGSPKAIETNSSCDDLDTKEHSLAEDKRLNLDEYEKRQGLTSNEVPKGSSLSSRGSPKAIETNSSCDDLGTKDKSLADDKRLNLDESEKRQGLTSSSSVSSKEEEEVSDFLISHRGVSESAELPLPAKDSFSPARPGSPLWEQSESPSKNALHIDGKGNESERMDQDKVLFSRTSSRQNSVNDRSVETEVDVSYSEYLNTTNISQDSADGNKDEDRRKGADSFFVGLIKKSFRDLSKSSQTLLRTRPNVLINGQPIPDHLVKKAEKLAGPIQPGDYWYDFRAGFWGVMGQTCLGIIPPFIEEFYYPMPANCGAGNTGVFVNGRELHQRDLDLLASRGLPTTKDKFYIVEISGRVVDEDSGKELDSLGKLAPTIEKAKHGFGMKVPRMAV